jgi:hypothetical protein
MENRESNLQREATGKEGKYNDEKVEKKENIWKMWKKFHYKLKRSQSKSTSCNAGCVTMRICLVRQEKIQ